MNPSGVWEGEPSVSWLPMWTSLCIHLFGFTLQKKVSLWAWPASLQSLLCSASRKQEKKHITPVYQLKHSELDHFFGSHLPLLNLSLLFWLQQFYAGLPSLLAPACPHSQPALSHMLNPAFAPVRIHAVGDCQPSHLSRSLCRAALPQRKSTAPPVRFCTCLAYGGCYVQKDTERKLWYSSDKN